MSLVCGNGHYFDKPLKRYADLFCPECSTKEVFVVHPDDEQAPDPYAIEDGGLD